MNTKLINWCACTLLAASLSLPACVQADEGMFTFNNPPKQKLQQQYGFTMTDAWLNHSMKAAVRFNNGGSGGFVSPDGLVITNHHIADETLSQLSSPQDDLIAKGFLAKTRTQELAAPDLELNCLQSIVDVTKAINEAVKPGMTPAQAAAARTAKMAEIEQASLKETGLRSDVVTLYNGGQYQLYRYKKYTDVRLVWAPEQDAAFFGGDADNFEYPRQSLDVALFRVYENGQPVHPEHFFSINPQGPKEGELVFVVGHPGSTNRQDTLARLEHYRDYTLPYRLSRVRTLEAALQQFAQRDLENARRADNSIRSVANSRKVFYGMFEGLLNKTIVQRRVLEEEQLRAQAASQKPWETIAEAQKKLQGFEEVYSLLEGRDACPSPLFSYARHLVRLAQEEPKPSAERLREYRDSNLESLKDSLFAGQPIYDNLEIVKMTAGLMLLAERLGGDNPDVQMILEGKSPAVRAAELVKPCTIAVPLERRSLYEGGQAAIDKSTDPMIRLAVKMDKRARELRAQYESEVKEPELKAYAEIAQERFKQKGTAVPPDATFTLRLSYGVVKGYQDDETAVPWHTVMGDAYRVSDAHFDTKPYNLPASWKAARHQVNWQTPFVFVATSDTIGGNSGSPVLNCQGQLVGVNFDRNQFGMVRNFVYDETKARHMSVSAPALAEALKSIYHAQTLLEELGLSGR